MYVRVFVCMRVCVCVCDAAVMKGRQHNFRTYMCMIDACMCMYVCMNVCVCTCVCMYMCMCVYVCDEGKTAQISYVYVHN